MAADVVVESGPPNPCCAEIRKKCAKLEEGRNALRKAVKLLDKETKKLLAERDSLKKAYAEEQMCVNLEKEAKERESTMRSKLEKEVCQLMSEISSYPERNSSGRIDELESKVVEREAEIRRLKELVTKEERRADCEKKRGDAETKKTAEAWKLLKLEKSKAEDERRVAEAGRNKADQERKVAETERKKAEEARLHLVSFQKEESGVREKLIADANKKLEAEEQKTSRERKRAASEKAKAEELRRLLEVERKKLMDEKARGDHIVQQLEEEKQRRVVVAKKLGKKREKYSSFDDNGRCINEQNQESTKVKLLEEQLKLEKKRVKYAQRVARLEKREKSFMSQQIHLLKQDLIQFSFRLDSLDGHISHGIEGRNMPKIGKCPEPSSFILQNKFLGRIPDITSDQDFKMLSDPRDPLNHSGSGREFAELGLSGGSCHLRMPGTCSELDSPLGGSIRKMSQSSAVCSTSTSFSDKKFIGSQGKDAFPIANMVSLAENSSKPTSTALRFAGKVTKTPRNENAGVVGENFGGIYVQNNSVHGKSGTIVPEKLSHSRKKRRMQDTLESLTWLYSEDDQLHRVIGEKPSTLEDLVNNKGSVPGLVVPSGLGHSKHVEVVKHPLIREHDSLRRNFEPARKSVGNKQRKCTLEPCAQSQGQKQVDEFINGSITPAHTRDNIHENREPVSAVGNNKSALGGFGHIVSGDDFMKLLDLDNDDEERRYREAVEMPLSPSLPDIGYPSPRLCGEDNSPVEGLISDDGRHFVHLSEGLGSNRRIVLRGELEHCNISSSFSKPKPYSERLDENEKTETACVEDNSVINIPPRTNRTNETPRIQSGSCGGNDIESIPKECDGSVIACDVMPEALGSERRKSFDAGGSLSNGRKASQAIFVQTPESTTTVVGQGVPSFDDRKNSYAADGGLGFETVRYLCVVSPDAKNKDSVSRIVTSMSCIIAQNCMISQKDDFVPRIVNALALEADLRSEEKVSVLFSTLLYYVSNRWSLNSTSVVNAELLGSSEAFAAEMKRVSSDETMKKLFLDVCQLDILVVLIHDFLIDGKVLACYEADKPLIISRKLDHSNWENISLSCIAATFDQLLAGSIILASICAAFDQVTVLLEISYKILCQWRKDTHCCLLVLHIFASVCGMNFLVVDDHNLLITAIRLVVSLLERQHDSGFTSCALPHPANAVERCFPPCEHCPFAANAVGVDKFTSMLLDMLHDYASNGNRYPDVHKSTNAGCSIPTCADVIEKSTCNGSVMAGPKVDCDTSCPLLLHKRISGNYFSALAERAFCCFTDILSLVELVGCYMSWEWTYKQVVTRLLKILEACVHQEYSAAIFLLVGQLGRLGIDAGGYQQNGIADVKCHLTMLLGRSFTGKMKLFTQFAAIGSLLNFVPLKFQEIIDGCPVLSADDNVIELIKKWFAELSMEEKSLSLDLFCDAGAHKM